MFYRKFIKRFIDVLISLFILVLFSPLLLLIGLLIKLKIGSPILFKQQRPGINEKIFVIYKFRTMVDTNDKYGNPLPDSERITNFGTFLRKTSLDELPELFNVFKGEMSLVGPRPLLIKYLPFYTEREKKRHLVLPGITGLAQVSGRNLVDWDKRLELDAYYVENISFLIDMKILILTIGSVFFSRGVSVDSSKVEPAFNEYRKNKEVL